MKWWVCSSVAPSCITMTMIRPQLLKFRGSSKCAPDRVGATTNSLRIFLAGRVAVHGDALGGARFVNDPFEKAADGRIRQRATVVIFGVGQHFVFARRLIDRHARSLFEAPDLEGAP